uniref:Uncharacterized protein n=1 Tax=Kalanchoe fedtschenkoi TaxID=63787 RepID=A0A7N0U5V2_KALFE
MAVFDENPVADAKVGNKQMNPPSRPPLPKRVKGKKMITKSITKLEIERFWKNKHMEEEDHLFAAIKAAARVRARNLTEEIYKRFEESLKENKLKEGSIDMNENHTNKDEFSEEPRVGIKDWWTKSKYAYLNQPAIGTSVKKKRASSYIPNSCFYKTPVSSPGITAAYLGVF